MKNTRTNPSPRAWLSIAAIALGCLFGAACDPKDNSSPLDASGSDADVSDADDAPDMSEDPPDMGEDAPDMDDDAPDMSGSGEDAPDMGVDVGLAPDLLVSFDGVDLAHAAEVEIEGATAGIGGGISITMRNAGSAPLEISDVRVPVADLVNAELIVIEGEQDAETVYDPTDERTVTIGFSPLAEGRVEVPVEVSSNDPDVPEFVVIFVSDAAAATGVRVSHRCAPVASGTEIDLGELDPYPPSPHVVRLDVENLADERVVVGTPTFPMELQRNVGDMTASVTPDTNVEPGDLGEIVIRFDSPGELGSEAGFRAEIPVVPGEPFVLDFVAHFPEAATVAGETCDAAPDIEAFAPNPSYFQGDTSMATDDVQLPESCAGDGFVPTGEPDMVVRFTPDETARYLVRREGTSGPSLIYGFTDCEDIASTCVGAYDAFDRNTALDVELMAGTTYYFAFDGYDGGDEEPFRGSIRRVPDEPMPVLTRNGAPLTDGCVRHFAADDSERQAFIRVTNNGGADVEVTDIQITDAVNADMVPIEPPRLVIPSVGSESLGVVVTVPDPGRFEATLNVTTDVGELTPVRVYGRR